MNGKLRTYLPLGLLLLLILWCLWYLRPVGVETVFPGLEPDVIEVGITDFNDQEQGNKTLRLDKGTVEYDALWPELQTLRFRRSPLNPLRQALPFLNAGIQNKHPEGDDITDLSFTFRQDNGEDGMICQLRFFVDQWYYDRTLGGPVLPLGMEDGKAVGQELAQRLWDQAERFLKVVF